MAPPHVVPGGGYCILAPPTAGLIRLHPFRTLKARYRARGPHTVITVAVLAARIAWRAVFRPF